jgi:hypothetical protein
VPCTLGQSSNSYVHGHGHHQQHQYGGHDRHSHNHYHHTRHIFCSVNSSSVATSSTTKGMGEDCPAMLNNPGSRTRTRSGSTSGSSPAAAGNAGGGRVRIQEAYDEDLVYDE